MATVNPNNIKSATPAAETKAINVTLSARLRGTAGSVTLELMVVLAGVVVVGSELAVDFVVDEEPTVLWDGVGLVGDVAVVVAVEEVVVTDVVVDVVVGAVVVLVVVVLVVVGIYSEENIFFP